MKIKSFLFLFLISTSAFAYQMVDSIPESEYRFYIKGGVTTVLPTAGVGFRYKNGHHGFDASANFATIGWVSAYSGKLLYLNHPFPFSSPAHNFYVGVGAGAGSLESFPFTKNEFRGFSAEQCIGYQWKGKNGKTRFAQFEFSESPFKNWLPIPALLVGFGF